jgi:hypothetical protein
MTCYVKHLSGIMRRAGAENTYENKQLLDSIVRGVLSMQRNDCPEVWKRVKSIMFGGDAELKKRFEDGVVEIFIKRLITG